MEFDGKWPESSGERSPRAATGIRFSSGIVREYAFPVAFLAIAAALLAYAASFFIAPVYRSTSTILIQPTRGKIVSVDDVNATSDIVQNIPFYQTQIELLKSPDLAARTAKAVELWKHPEFNASLRQKSFLSAVRDAIRGDETNVPSEQAVLYEAAGGLVAGLKVEQVGLSQLVKISFDSRDPNLASRVAETQAQEYIAADREARAGITNEANSFIVGRLAIAQENLTKAEQALQQYRDRKGIAAMPGSNQTAANLQVTGVSEKLYAATAKRIELESAYRQVSSRSDLVDVPAVMRDRSVMDASDRVTLAKQRLTELSQTLGSKNARVLSASEELTQATAALRQQRAFVAASIKREFEAARTTEGVLQDELRAAGKGIQAANRNEFELVALERDAQINRDLVNVLLARSRETALLPDTQIAVARIVDHARPSAFPIKPARSVIAASAMLLALLTCIGLIIVREKYFGTVRSVEDIEELLNLPALASVPFVGAVKAERISRSVLDEPYSRLAEAIHVAQTGLMLGSRGVAKKIILVSSVMPGEGKTTFACNLALSYAKTERTLLIDADMRRSRASRRLGLPAGAIGITDLLCGTAQARETVHAVDGSTLVVLPVGNSVPKDPFELLVSKQFNVALAGFSEHFDVIILDSPPMGLVSDAMNIVPLASTTVLVIKAASTKINRLLRIIEKIRRSGAAVPMCILNGVIEAKSEMDGYYDVRADLESVLLTRG